MAAILASSQEVPSRPTHHRSHHRSRAFVEVLPPALTFKSSLHAAIGAATRFVRIRRSDFAILRWAPTYNLHLLRVDGIAAMVVGTMLLPQAMAYALLAGLPPQYGLYSSIFPSFLYGVITTCGVLAPGPVASSSILIAAQVRGLTSAAPLSAEWIATALQLSAVVGVVQLVLGLLRFGAVARLLSYPVMAGFTAAAAILIILSQAPGMLGIPSPPPADSSFVRFGILCAELPKADWRPALLGIACLATLVYGKRAFSRVVGRPLPTWVPIPLVLVLLGALISWTADFFGHGMAVVGPIPRGLPWPTAPLVPSSGAAWVAMLPSAILVGLVAYVQTASLALVFGRRAGDDVNANTELIALGVTSLFGTCFSSYAVTGSITRTALQAASGARTPASVLLCGLFMVAATLGLAPLFSVLPIPVLGSIIISAAVSMLDLSDVLSLWRSRASDFLAYMTTALVILAVDIQTGLIAGIAVSVLMLVLHSFAPRIVELGQLPGTEVFISLARYPQAERVAGARIFRIDGELHFGNVTSVSRVLQAVLAEAVAAREAVAVCDSRQAENRITQAAASSEAQSSTEGVISTSAQLEGGQPNRAPRTVVVGAAGKRRVSAAAADGVDVVSIAMRDIQRRQSSGGSSTMSSGTASQGDVRLVYAVVSDGDDDFADDVTVVSPTAHTSAVPLRRRNRGAFVDEAPSAPVATDGTQRATAELSASQHAGTSDIDIATLTSAPAADACAVTCRECRRSQPPVTPVSAHMASATPQPEGFSSCELDDASSMTLQNQANDNQRQSARFCTCSSSRQEVRLSMSTPSEMSHCSAANNNAFTGVDDSIDTEDAAAGGDASSHSANVPPLLPLRAVIVDGCRIVDVDATAWREMREVASAYALQRVALVWAALPGPVRDTIERVEMAETRRLANASSTAEANPPRRPVWFISVAAALMSLFGEPGDGGGDPTNDSASGSTPGPPQCDSAAPVAI